jgi:protein-S-isoprenylcysteine O-methyltransferase Ste14
MKVLLRLLVRHARALLAGLTVLTALSQFHLLLWLLPLEPSVLQLQLAFSATAFWQVLAQWGAEGTALYAGHFALDQVRSLLFAAWGALMVSSSGLFDGLLPHRRWTLAAWLPAAAVLNLLENGAHLHLLAQAPGSGDILVPLVGTVSLLKWLLLLGFAGLLAWRGQQVLVPLLVPRLALRVPPVALAVACALLTGLQAWSAVSARWPVPWALPAAVAALGLGLALAAAHALRHAHTTLSPMRLQATRTLVVDGVYRFSRNPVYLGLALLLLAWTLWLGYWRTAWAVPFFMAYLHAFQIGPEEQAMHDQFGPAFRLYCARVRRWL